MTKQKHTFIECVDMLGVICGRSRYAPVFVFSCSGPCDGYQLKEKFIEIIGSFEQSSNATETPTSYA